VLAAKVSIEQNGSNDSSDVHGYAIWPAKAVTIDERSNNIARHQHFVSRDFKL